MEEKWLTLALAASDRASRLESVAAPNEWVVLGAPENHVAQSVAAALQQRGDLHAKVGRFIVDRNFQVNIREPLTGKNVVICSSMRPSPKVGDAHYNSAPANTLKTLLLQLAAEEQGASAVHVVEAYQMNGRSDREEHGHGNAQQATHMAAYSGLVPAWRQTLKMDHVVVVEPHDLHTLAAWSPGTHRHATHIDGTRLLVETTLAQLPTVPKRHRILALPDGGSHKRTKELQKLFDRVVTGTKTRTDHDSGPRLHGFDDTRPFKQEDVILLCDDEMAGGSTMAQTIAKLRAQGAQCLHVLIVHNNLTLDPVQRQCTLAWLRHLGATSLRFTDTHAMGHVVHSFEEVCAMTPDAVRMVEAFFTAKDVHAAPEKLFLDLGASVHSVSIGHTVASQLVSAAS